MSQTRIYVVKCKLDGHTSPRLVEATSVSTAIRHCMGDAFTAEAAGPKDIVELMGNGVKVERVQHDDRKPEATV
jgi:hypothetical protein